MSEGPAEHTAAVLRCQIPLGRLSVESLSRSFPGVRSDPKRQEAQGTRKAKGEAGSEEKTHKEAHTEEKERARKGKKGGGYAPDTSTARSVGALKLKSVWQRGGWLQTFVPKVGSSCSW